MIKYLSQPVNSNQCGQTVLAMLLGEEIKTVCKLMNKSGGTRNSDLVKVLTNKGIKHNYKRCKYFEHIPKVAIVKIGFEGYNHTHWTLKYKDTYFDPEIGIIKNYNEKFINPISYIEVI